MLTFCVFKWRPPGAYRKTFGARQVDIHRRMVRRHYPAPHRYVLITDDPTGITEPDIEIFELWRDHANVPSPFGAGNPSCYRRLRLFARNAGQWLGERIVMMDLDCVILDDLRPLFAGGEDFKIWENPTAHWRTRTGQRSHVYNGGFWMLRAGARPQLWEDFDPIASPKLTKAAGLFGSDQAWISHCLGPNEKTWTPDRDGVRSWKFDVLAKHNGVPPPGTRIVWFHGKPDPHAPEVWNRCAWVRDHYR